MKIGFRPFFLAAISGFPGATVGAAPLSFPQAAPVEAAQASKTFHVVDGFEMQLIAAEPLVTDPVAITYDEDGRAYVCEMNDYPYTDKAGHKHNQENPTDQPLGRVRLLTDSDGDGVFDRATVFADGLSWPTGAACWKGGIFVTATPDIWYLKDTNGDGVADVRQKVFTGFRKLNVQAVMNNPIWGLDHRIYVAGGSNGGEIHRAAGSENVMPLPKGFKPLAIKRQDFSFDPGSGDVRLETGGARFGNTFDDWGNRFLCNIRNPCQHVVLPYRYLERNPYLTVSGAMNDCAEAGDQLPVYRTSPPEPWREFRARRWSQEGSTLPRSELVGAGVVTSSSGIAVYRGDAYPPEYRDFAFVADVAGNLFYRMKLVPDGITFKAVQVDGQKNFCTSDDLWFRPVNFVNAPDGCLHVCDMYREVIEHPWSIPDDIHAVLDLLRGRDRGRIWRLAPPRDPRSQDAAFRRRAPKLGSATTVELVALLDHPNAWHRESAQRLLFERQDKGATEHLKRLVAEGKTPQGRAHAIWALHALDALGPGPSVDFRAPGRLSESHRSADRWVWLKDAGITQEAYGLLLGALRDPDARVRRQVVRVRPEALLAPRELAELYSLRPDAGRLLDDPDRTVRIEAILSHALVWSPAAFPRFGEICVREDDQPQVLRAALLACAESSFTMFQAVLKSPKLARSAALQDFLCENAAMIGRAYRNGDPDAPYHVMRHLVLRGAPDALARRVVHALSLALRRSGSSIHEAAIAAFDKHSNEAALRWIQELKEAALKDLSRPDVAIEDRSLALGLLPDLLSARDALQALSPFLAAAHPTELQLAALDALNAYRDPAVAEILLAAWKTLTPTLREKAQSVLLSRPDRIRLMLAAIESGAIPRTQISAATRAMLAKNRDQQISARAAKLFGDVTGSSRAGVIDRYARAIFGEVASQPGPSAGNAAPPVPGDAMRGEKVYQTACLVCHKHGNQGNDVGPHLGTIKAWTPEQLLTNILDPNREVSPNFALYVIEMTDGRTLSGIVANESGGNLVLKRADGGQETLLRSEIKSLSSPGISLMPEGLEAAITPQQMADLIEFLRR